MLLEPKINVFCQISAKYYPIRMGVTKLPVRQFCVTSLAINDIVPDFLSISTTCLMKPM
jgi:hypothetical protein